MFFSYWLLVVVNDEVGEINFIVMEVMESLIEVVCGYVSI